MLLEYSACRRVETYEENMLIRIECELELPDQSPIARESLQARITDFMNYLTNDCGLQPIYAAALLDSMAESLRPESDELFDYSNSDLEDDSDEPDTFGVAENEIKQLDQYKALVKLEKQYERAERLEKGTELLGLAAEMLLAVPGYYSAAKAIAAKHSARLPISFGHGYFLRDEEDEEESDGADVRRLYISEPFNDWRLQVFAKFGFTDGFRAKAAAIKLIHVVHDHEVFDRALGEELEGAAIYEQLLPVMLRMKQFTSKELAAELELATTQVSAKLPSLASIGIIRRLPQSKGHVQYEIVSEVALKIQEAKALARETLQPLLG